MMEVGTNSEAYRCIWLTDALGFEVSAVVAGAFAEVPSCCLPGMKKFGSEDAISSDASFTH